MDETREIISYPVWMASACAGFCKYQSGVMCSDKNCGGCGWNPDVEAARKQKIRAALTEQGAAGC